MLVVRGPTCWYVMFFVELSFFALPLLPLLLRTFVALRTIGGPNPCVILVRIELRNLWGEIGVVLSL